MKIKCGIEDCVNKDKNSSENQAVEMSSFAKR